MKKKDQRVSRAFIAAPAQTDLYTIKQELIKRNVKPITAYELTKADSIVNQIEQAIQSTDLFIAIIPSDMSPNIYFELGLAHAFKKRLLLLVSPNLKELPSDISGSLYFRSDPDNSKTIGFALDQLLAGHEQKQYRYKKPQEGVRPLGDLADEYLQFLNKEKSSLDGQKLEQLLEELLKASGVSTVTRNPERDSGIDLAVWSDELQEIVGNPFLIEVKSRVRSKQDLRQALEQVEHYRQKSNSKWALLILSALSATAASIPVLGGVLAVTMSDLVERLRTRSFADVIRELRNERVHGGTK